MEDKIQTCIQKMVEDGYIPRGSRLVPGTRYRKGKPIGGCDYIRTPRNEVIPFEHRNNHDVLDAVLEGRYRIGRSALDKNKRVVEIKQDNNWIKLEAKTVYRLSSKWKKRQTGST